MRDKSFPLRGRFRREQAPALQLCSLPACMAFPFVGASIARPQPPRGNFPCVCTEGLHNASSVSTYADECQFLVLTAPLTSVFVPFSPWAVNRQSCDFFFFLSSFFEGFTNATKFSFVICVFVLLKRICHSCKIKAYSGVLRQRRFLCAVARHKNFHSNYWRYLLWLAVLDLMYSAKKKRKN